MLIISIVASFAVLGCDSGESTTTPNLEGTVEARVNATIEASDQVAPTAVAQPATPTLAPAHPQTPLPNASPAPTFTSVPVPTATPLAVPAPTHARPTTLTPTTTLAPTATTPATATPKATSTPMPAATPTTTPTPGTATTPEPTPEPTPVPALPTASLLDLYRQVEELPWYRDGVRRDEETMVANLKRLAQNSKAAFEITLSRSWIANQDGEFSGNEQDAVRESVNLAAVDPWLARQVVNMPFLETVETRDVVALRALLEIAHKDPGELRQILALPDFQPGITDELSGLIPVYRLDLRDRESADAIRSLPWVSDEVPSLATESGAYVEAGTIQWLYRIAARHPEVFWVLIRSDWIRGGPDGITWAHMNSVLDILQITEVHEDSALQILDLPFLDSLEHDDAFVMSFLNDLVKYDLEHARRLISKPAVQNPAQASTSSDFHLLFLRDLGPDVVACIDSIQWLQAEWTRSGTAVLSPTIQTSCTNPKHL